MAFTTGQYVLDSVPLIVPKGVTAHLSAPNQLTVYESRNNSQGNPLIEDRPWSGYGVSGKLHKGSWVPRDVARAWHELKGCLGYDRYVAHGGDWGAIISEVMAAQAPTRLLGIHTNMPGVALPDVVQMVRTRASVPATFSQEEKAAYASLDVFYTRGLGYVEIMNTDHRRRAIHCWTRRSA
jgi:hypothetical protein